LRGHERPQLGLSAGELAVAALVANLARMLVLSRPALPIRGDADGSAMLSCSAAKPTAVAGTSVGSAKNLPSILTVPHCTANPSRL
jgi:hypothetical protein